MSIAVETLIDPLYLVCPSNKAKAVIGIKVDPNRIDAKIIPNLSSIITGINIPKPIIAQAKKRAMSFPIFLPNQGHNITIGIPAEENILDTYLNITGLDKPKYWKYLLAFNSFRFTGILQGIAKRVIDGNNAGNNGYEVGEQAEPVAKLGAQILKEYL